MEQFFTVAQAAHLLQVNPETIRRMIRRGELPYVKIGQTYRINPSDIRTRRNPIMKRPPRKDESPLAEIVRVELERRRRNDSPPNSSGGR
jgi:excisionase family DNA binding protein